MAPSVKSRLIKTAIIFVAAWIARNFIGPIATVNTAQMAGRQFDNNDIAAVHAQIGMAFFSGIGGLITLLVAIGLVVVWWPQIKKGYMFLASSTLMLALVFGAPPAKAYFETTEKTEAYTIMPNESAFWIPDIGANKDNQTSLDSEAYFQANKIAVKRFIIPHTKLSNSGGWGSWDYYVPTGRLILVDRSPYNREWVRSPQRGTSPRDESFPCQTNEGINVTAEVTIAASVTEEASPRFLHYFGVNAPTGNVDRTDGHVIFQSVYYGRSLTQVMDTIGRGLIQAAVCREIGSRDLTTTNKEYNIIMESVSKAAVKFLGDRGITLDYVGWAGTFTFDKDVQQAINDRFNASAVGSVIPILQAKAQIDAIEGWDHHLPQSVSLWWWPSSFSDALKDLFGGKK